MGLSPVRGAKVEIVRPFGHERRNVAAAVEVESRTVDDRFDGRRVVLPSHEYLAALCLGY